MEPNNRRVTVYAIVAILVMVQIPAASSLGLLKLTKPGELLVGFDGEIDHSLLAVLNLQILREMPQIGVVHVRTLDLLGVQLQLQLAGVAFVEANDATKLTSSSWDASSWDASSWDASSWDASSWDGSSWDASSWDASSWDASSWDVSSWDASSWDSSSWDSSSWDASSWDASSWDVSSWDASSWDVSSWDASSWDASSWDVSSWDASSWDAAAWTDSADPGYGQQWGLGAANFPDAWTVNNGRNRVGICILDTGVDVAHPDLRPALWRAPEGTLGHSSVLGDPDVVDTIGHGTHVAGIIGAVRGNGQGIAGAATERILNIKVMNANGGSESDLAAGLIYCVDHGARVASMSLHTTTVSPALKRAIAYADQHGVLMIAAAGNAGASGIPQPAADPRVMAIGALKTTEQRAAFSNYGSQLDLVAPGYRIASTLVGGYAIGSGTSQAVPFVAAAAALLFDERPDLSASEVRAILQETARDLGPTGVDSYYGHGALDAGAAMLAATGP